LFALTGWVNQLAVLHQIKNFGGTRSRKQHKIVAVGGTDVDAKVVIVEPSSLLTFQEVIAPTGEELLKCRDKAEVENCTCIDGAKYRTKYLPVIAPPPLIISLLLETEQGDPMELIPLITRAAMKFDEEKGIETGMENL
jgi:hypothetical protein